MLLMLIIGRLGWLWQNEELVFESDVTALLPSAENSWLEAKIDHKEATRLNNRIAIIVQGRDITQTDLATDRFEEWLTAAITQKQIAAKWIETVAVAALTARIEAMLAYKDRLIATRTRQRMQDSATAQLLWRSDQVTQFPPLNITAPAIDPLGTIEEFLAERLPQMRGVYADGVYLRVDSHTPANLLLLELDEGEPGSWQASDSVRRLDAFKQQLVGEFNVNLYISGVPLHATAIKEQTITELHWMVVLATLLTMGIFLYVTRALRALIVSTLLILCAVASGLVISQGSVGLPHLIGLTMAVTAIGICIDFSLHFWIHVRTGLSGQAAIRAIRSGINMSFLTTVIGLLVIMFTAVPVLVRSAMFICGALFVSWLLVLFVIPRFAGNTQSTMASLSLRRIRPNQLALWLGLFIACVSVVGLLFKYHTDDSPLRLGRQIESLAHDDQAVQDLLNIAEQPSIYLLQADSAQSLIMAEANLLAGLDDTQLTQVEAVSRLVIPAAEQRANQLLFNRLKNNLDATLLQQYLAILQVPALHWESTANTQYTLPWVLAQPWATLERDHVVVCQPTICASMLRAWDTAAKQLDVACQQRLACSRISLSQRQLLAFAQLRLNLIWTLLLALTTIFVVLYFRYRKQAFKLMMVPILASLSGLATVAWAGMPITVFSLAALFPLLGLSLDYVIFASETSKHSAATFLAIFASALTTTLSFWILSFSETAAVQFFALPIAVGIVVAWILVQVMHVEQHG